MSNILLNYGLVPDILKLKERKLLFKNYKHFYYIPDYIPDSKTHTVYIFDDNDIEFCKQIFHDKRPTNVELFDLSQSNSEHSRHWFFKGGYKIQNDNEIVYDDICLFDKVKNFLWEVTKILGLVVAVSIFVSIFIYEIITI